MSEKEVSFWQENWIAIIWSGFLLFLICWFLIGVATSSPSYDDHPSIYDEEWQRDMYGGTEYYED